MPRTLSAQLESAFDTLNFNPYIRIHVGTDNGATTETYLYTIQPISYKIEALHAEFSCEVFTTDIDEIQTFYIERGAYISGTPDTVKSAVFAVNSLVFDGRIMHVKGDLMPKEGGIIVGYQSYNSAIDNALSNAAISVGTFNYEGTPAWKDYKFLPSTRNINNPEYFFSLLRQKYLIFIFEDGHTSGAESFNTVGIFCATDARTQDYTITDKLFKFETGTAGRQFIWRDEAGTIHTSGTAKLVHNLGYLESTDNPPTNTASPLPGSKAIVPIHLKYQRGDYVTINSGDGETREYTGRIDVVEILDTKHEPSWYCEITPLVHFANTEGGALPSTIERVAAYTPLVTTDFNNNLDETVNNLQAFADAVDNLTLNNISDANATDLTDGGETTLHKHQTNTPLYTFLNLTTVPAGATRYILPGYDALLTGFSLDSPIAGSLLNLFFKTSSAQPAGGSLVVTLQVNGADTALTITIPANGGAGGYSNTSNEVSVSSGNSIRFKVKNNDGGNPSATILGLTVVQRSLSS